MNPYLLCAGYLTATAFAVGCVAGLTYWSWR